MYYLVIILNLFSYENLKDHTLGKVIEVAYFKSTNCKVMKTSKKTQNVIKKDERKSMIIVFLKNNFLSKFVSSS